ncbi:hypothetical protein BDD12DRAFT_1391 [Trichophaea hybrida]|nr:hypothetical protein BDD12DRAFT_1391 [Trichophaea hybrida]
MNSAGITIRPAVFPDIAEITQICIKGLPDDPTFNYLWSRRHEYPNDNYFFWLQKFKANLFDPRYTMLVAVHQKNPTPSFQKTEAIETIISVALWERNGSSSAAKKRARERNTWGNKLNRGLTWVENWFISKNYTRRDVNPEHLAQFQKVMNEVHKQHWEKKYPENFRLDLLCTHPDWREHGAGTMLTKWGIHNALQESVAVGVESSPMGFPLYESLGFCLIETKEVQVDGEDEILLVRVMVKEVDECCWSSLPAGAPQF